jgi:hypothetical protein
MLFFLDISEDDLVSVPSGLLATLASELARARRFGNHLVVMSRRSVEWIVRNVDLSQRDSAMLVRISQEYAQTANIRTKAKVYVRLSTKPEENLTCEGNSIAISLEYATQYDLLSRPVLVVENQENDGRLFEFILENHCDHRMIANLAYEISHGGGADLPRVFAAHARMRKVVCAVVDSDRDSPLSVDWKLDELEGIKSMLGWPLCFPMTLPCREAENMIPMPLTMQLPAGFRNASNAVLLRIHDAEVAAGVVPSMCYWLFVDLKEGIKPGKLNGMEDAAAKEWIKSKLRLAGAEMDERELSGYGGTLIQQIFDENRFCSELRKLTREQWWRSIFSIFLEELAWPLVASVKVIT